MAKGGAGLPAGGDPVSAAKPACLPAALPAGHNAHARARGAQAAAAGGGGGQRSIEHTAQALPTFLASLCSCSLLPLPPAFFSGIAKRPAGALT